MSVQKPLLLAVSSLTLVFGLEWFPLLGAQTRRQSMRLARKYGASHRVLSSDQAASVGLVSLRLKGDQRNQSMYSAAQSLTRLFPQGTVALILALPDQRWWLAAVHQGAVIARTDRLYGSLELALAALNELRPAYPQLRYLDGITEVAPTLSQLHNGADAHTALHKTVRWHSVLPLPVQLFVLALVLVLLLPRLWEWSHDQGLTAAQAVQIDPVLVWQQAISQAVRSRVLHGLAGTQVLLDSLYDLPVVLAGWRLAQIECTPGALSWVCSGNYQRHARLASNDGLLSLLPAGWTTRFPTIDLAQIDWTVPVSGLPLAWQALKITADIDRHWLSALQAIRPAFTQMELGKPVALPVSQPHDQHGQPLSRPEGLPVYMLRPVQINGPLRSFMLLLPHTAAIEWRRVVLSINDTTQATLKNSQVSVSFQGVQYEIPSIPKHYVSTAAITTQAHH